MQKLGIPNILSLIRLAMVPVFMIVFFFFDKTEGHWIAATLYAVATLTDALDGIIARRTNAITKLGRVLDPMADKLMSFMVLLCIAVSKPHFAWAVVVFFVKEALMSIGALVQFKRIGDVPPAKFIGKFATVFFFLTCFSVMVIPAMPETAAQILIAAALSLTIIAFVSYLRRFISLTAQKRG